MPDTMTFQFLDVGMGDGTLVQIRRNRGRFDHLMLVDFGERRSPFDVAQQDAFDYLVRTIAENSEARDARTPFVDHLVLTHPDGDHYNMVQRLLDARYAGFRRRLRFGALSYSGSAREYGRLITRSLDRRVDAARGLRPMPDNAHSRLDDDELRPWARVGSVNIYLLSANWPTRAGDNNAKSIVLMFELDDERVILTGDATRATERHILRDVLDGNPDLISCHALKLGHHGSNGSSGQAWVDATEPHAIFASGDMVWSHPYCRPICRFIDTDRLIEHFPVDSYYCCGERDSYFNNATRVAIGMNLWYFIKRSRERLRDESRRGAIVWGYRGNTYGVQWALTVSTRADMQIDRTETCVPTVAAVTPPFECHPAALADGRPEELLASLDALPPTLTDPDPAAA